MLSQLLKENPSWDLQQLSLCVVHRFQSKANHSELPASWVSRLPEYASGPIDRYGKPQGNGANGKAYPKFDGVAQMQQQEQEQMAVSRMRK